MRNQAALAIKDQPDPGPAAIAALCSLLEDEEHDPRWRAAVALTQLAAPESREAVEKLGSPEGGLWLNVSRGSRADSTGELAVVRWARPNARGDADLPEFRIGWARVLAPNHSPLNADLSQAILTHRDMR